MYPTWMGVSFSFSVSWLVGWFSTRCVQITSGSRSDGIDRNQRSQKEIENMRRNNRITHIKKNKPTAATTRRQMSLNEDISIYQGSLQVMDTSPTLWLIVGNRVNTHVVDHSSVISSCLFLFVCMSTYIYFPLPRYIFA